MTDDETDDADGFERDEEAGVAPGTGDGDERENEDRREGDREDGPLGDLADEVRRRRGASSDGGPSEDGGSGSDAPPGEADADEPAADRGAGRDGPLGDLADEIRGRRADRDAAGTEASRAEASGTDAAGEAFTEMEHREIDSQQLWETLDDEETDRVAVGDPADDPADGAERVIPKRTCETCPHFAEPPEVACAHEGTEILELVGMDEHRVVNCPMVADEDALDD